MNDRHVCCWYLVYVKAALDVKFSEDAGMLSQVKASSSDNGSNLQSRPSVAVIALHVFQKMTITSGLVVGNG